MWAQLSEQVGTRKKQNDGYAPEKQVRISPLPEPNVIDKAVPITAADIKHRIQLQNILHPRTHFVRRPEDRRNPETNLDKDAHNIHRIL